MNAENVKLIFLSGTPIINRIYEITKIYNIIRGYMHVIEIQFKSTFDTGINYDKLHTTLKQNKYVDQIIINKAKKLIKITKNPQNFITSPDHKGLIYTPSHTSIRASASASASTSTSASASASASNKKFIEDIKTIITNMGYKFELTEKKETCFPEDEEIFEQMFYNRELNKIKRTDLIKKRIVGLTSYYEYQDKKEYPALKPINIVQVPMSEFQFGVYEKFRHQEIEEEKIQRRRQKPEDDDTTQTSYRIKSRLSCTFAFPEEIGNPYDTKAAGTEDYLEYIEKLDDHLDSFSINKDKLDDMKKKDIETKIKEGYTKLLEQDRAKYLDIKNGSLAKYSPKYLSMIMNIKKHAPHGKILVYSFFRSLIGLNSFSYALQQTGNWTPFKIKKVNKQWELDDTHIESENESKGKSTRKGDTKWKYVFYAGGEDSEVRDIYRKIINSEWDTLGANCEKLVKQLRAEYDNNYTGEVIKMMMTTKTGAEGLDLKEIRFIHIMEPYWQHVLIDQVIGRGVRNKSHLTLPESARNVEVFIYMATITPALVRKISYIDVRTDTYKYSNPALSDKINKVVSSDEYLYLTSERKRLIINEFQKLMKESSFDCALNYSNNKLNPANKGLVCMDYNVKNRDEYLYTPSLEDTNEGIQIAQEKMITIKYGSFEYKGKKYYYDLTPNAKGKQYIYDDKLIGKVRTPKPIGEVKHKNGKKSFAFYN